MHNIFIQIASYRDPELVPTINNCISRAKYPENLIFSIHHQYNVEDPFHKDIDLYRDNKNFRIIDTVYTESRGACWARNITEKQLLDEDYTLQIDSHSRFVQNWDEVLLDYYNKIGDNRAVITGYPPYYKPEDSEKGWGDFVCLNNVVDFNQISHAKPKILVTNKDFIKALHVNAGFIFSKSDLIKKVPYDPELYFMGEEFNLTIRYITNGYNLYHINKKICYHYYGERGEAKRHWNDNTGWGEIQNNSYKRIQQLIDGTDLGIYSLGTERTVDEFISFTGIDIINKKISTKTKNGEEPPINYDGEENYDKQLLIVVPYKNRLKHLLDYLEKVPSKIPYSYDILIIEQADDVDFNLGAISNTLIKFKTEVKYQWLYISHVDIYPENNIELPITLNDCFYRLGDEGSFIISYEKFIETGGFGNGFYGWGGEDNAIYANLRSKGVQLIDKIENSYHKEHQSHIRVFEPKNYFNTIRLVYNLNEAYKNAINNIDNICDIISLEEIKPNIYLQKVKLKKTSPHQSVNKNLIISSIFNLNDWNKVEPFVKSCLIHSAYSYDVVILYNNCSKELVQEINNHGVKTVEIDDVDFNMLKRFKHYSEYLKDKNYDKILHIDCTDVYIQDNPFKHVMSEITVANEGILIADEKWNKELHLKHFGDYPNRKVICAGIIGGSKQNFINLCESTFNYSTEYSYGIDQIFVNRIIDGINIKEYSPDDSFAIHLHTHFNNKLLPINISGKTVTNMKGDKFAIVHQYNRDTNLYNTVLNDAKYNNF